MKIFVISLLLLSTVVVGIASIPTEIGINRSEYDCGPNESFRECGHAAICDFTCDNFDSDDYIPCPPICVRRCICDWGFVRSESGGCVDQNECPARGDK